MRTRQTFLAVIRANAISLATEQDYRKIWRVNGMVSEALYLVVAGLVMDYFAEINRVYGHIDDDHVDKAVMACLRLARNLQDFMNAAVFLREMNYDLNECVGNLYEDTKHLKPEAQELLWKQSLEYWLKTHTLDFSMGTNEDGEENTVLKVSVSEIDSDIAQWEGSIADLQVPSGMGAFDTAAFTDNYTTRKAEIRLRIKALHTIKQRIKNRCLNYAITLERQLNAQSKSQSFLATMHTEVNNYFKSRSEDVFTKLVKAAQLVDSNDSEDFSLLLTEVRRAMKSCADFFYPAVDGIVKCADGKDRALGDDQYMNRLHEFILTKFEKSSSRDSMRTELDHLSVFARRLNDLASKGVHDNVSPAEAKQGLLGLYMFLFNVTTRLQQISDMSAVA
jgi:hypothetical protein